MKKCLACSFLMDDFDSTCPRCKGNGLSPDQVAALAAQKAAALPKPPISPRDVGQDVVNGLTGALIFLLPGLIIMLFLSLHIGSNQLSPERVSMGAKYVEPGVPRTREVFVAYLPVLFTFGALLGAWISSGFAPSCWKTSAAIGGGVLLGLTLVSPFIVGNSEAIQALYLYFTLFLVMACGAIGSIGRHRNGENYNDSLLIRQVGVAVLCFVAPLIGFFVSISLGKNGSEYAAPALYGSIAGFIVIGLPFLLIVLGH